MSPEPLTCRSDEASVLRVQYWRRYGATLLGMIRHHDVDPHEFLRETHQFPDLHELVRRQHALVDLLRRLPGRKILLTNAPRQYAHGVLRHLGIARILDRVICIEDMRFAGLWQPKPSVAMMRRLAAAFAGRHRAAASWSKTAWKTCWLRVSAG